jgi:hypothetical protein
MDPATAELAAKMIGQYVTFYCVNFIYYGLVVAVSDRVITLDKAHCVYNTGSHSDPYFGDSRPFPGQWHIPWSAIESFGNMHKKPR